MALDKTQVSQLYVSIFGRASEGDGNKYWQKQSSLKDAADEMLSSQPAKDYFGSTLNDNQAFIEFIYENTLNKTIEDDQSGIEYWVNQLEAGKTKGEVVSKLISVIEEYAPGGKYYDSSDEVTINAYKQFENRVEVSNYMADTVEKAPDDYEISTAFGKGLTVTYDDFTLSNAKLEVSKNALSWNSDALNNSYDLDTDFNFSDYDVNYDYDTIISLLETYENQFSGTTYGEYYGDIKDAYVVYNKTNDYSEFVDDVEDAYEDLYEDIHDDLANQEYDDLGSFDLGSYDFSSYDFSANNLDSAIVYFETYEDQFSGTIYENYFSDVKDAIIDYSNTNDLDEYVSDIYEAVEDFYSDLGYEDIDLSDYYNIA